MTKIIRPTPHRLVPEVADPRQDIQMSEDQPEEAGSSETVSNSQPRYNEHDEGSLQHDKKLTNISGEDKKSVSSGQENDEDGEKSYHDALDGQKQKNGEDGCSSQKLKPQKRSLNPT